MQTRAEKTDGGIDAVRLVSVYVLNSPSTSNGTSPLNISLKPPKMKHENKNQFQIGAKCNPHD
jgi:hypothetical protein